MRSSGIVVAAVFLLAGCRTYATPPQRAITYASMPENEHAQPVKETALFVERVRGRMDEIESRIHTLAEQGAVAPQALDELAQRRAQVEQALRETSEKGVIEPAERERVDEMVQEMEGVEQRWRIVGQSYGGGPRSERPPLAPCTSDWDC